MTFTNLILPKTVKSQIRILYHRIKHNTQDNIVILSGNTGTGKYSIAKLLAKESYHSKLTVVPAYSLIGTKMHTTTPLIRSYVKKAMNGVLYVPFASTLSHRSDTIQPYTKYLLNIIPIKEHLRIRNSAGIDTAISSLIKIAARNKSKITIILSDSHQRINTMLKKDRCLGLTQYYQITLPDYKESELDQIFDVQKDSESPVWNHPYSFDAIQQIKEYIHQYCAGALHLPRSYNTRFILDLIHKAALQCAKRVVAKKAYKNIKITSKDVQSGLSQLTA